MNELEQRLAEAGALTVQEIAQGSPVLDLAFVDDQQVGGHFFDVGQVVRRHEREGLGPIATKQAQHPLGRKHVEAIEGLVQNQQLGAVQQAGGNGHFLFHTGGERRQRLGAHGSVVFQQVAKQAVDARLGVRQIVDAGHETQVING